MPANPAMLTPQLVIPKTPHLAIPKKMASEMQSPLRPNAAVFSPILSAGPRGGFGIPPSPARGPGESLDQWFQNLRKHEARLASMASASEEPKFREELGTIEQWFGMLTESEQDASLYTLIQHASQEQLGFLKAILQQLTDTAGDNSRQASPATSRPPLHVRLPGTPRTPGFNLTSALSPSINTRNKDLDNVAVAAAAAMTSPTSAIEPGSQELFFRPAENSWANMVNTPMDLMFQKAQNTQNVPPIATNPMMMSMLNPAMMGYSNEAQMLALQLMMNGMSMQQQAQAAPVAQPAQNGNQKSSNQKKGQSAGASNWRSGGSGSSSARGPSKATPAKKAVEKEKPAAEKAAPADKDKPAVKPEDDFDPEILNDIPAWLKTLRLHKYTECFQHMSWQEIVVLSEDDLEKQGVTAMGARKRLTKNFEAVKRKMGMPGAEPAPEAAEATASTPA